jgi:hypothetical protein
MTRDFNEQRRYDGHPSSRNQSSGRYREERSPRPARPRLNRQTVDRAWESGARRDHADYRTRSNNEQPPRGNPRRNQYTDNTPAQNDRRPSNNYQDGYRRSQRTTNDNGYQSSRPRSYDPNTRHYDERRTNDRRSYSRGPNDAGPRTGSDFRDNDQRSPSRSSETRSPRTFDRGNRAPRNYQQRDTPNPRWQSRQWAQNDDRSHERQDFDSQEHFEGDYERFKTPERPQHAEYRSPQPRPGKRFEDRHVTRLPDGRALKGPRPAQRRNAQFWQEVAHDTETILEEVNTPPPVTNTDLAGNDEATTQRAPRKRAGGTAAHGQKARAKQKAAKPGPKPSRRGFKWPTP